MRYRCEATSVSGFIQQLAVGYIGRGYYFYVTGQVPEGKDPRRIDEKLVEKYGIDIGKTARARRKALERYVATEEWQLGEIQAGLADLESGHAVNHERVEKRLRSWGKRGESKPPR
jgi:hypothetical protein